MATTIAGTVTYLSSKYEYYVTCTESNVDSVNNQSDVTVKVYARKKSTYSSYTTVGTSQVQINGTNGTKITGRTIDLQTNTTAQLIQTTTLADITHTADGSKTVTIKAGEAVASGSGIIGPNDSSYSPYKGSCSGSFVLTTIAVGSTQSNQGEGTGGAGSASLSINGSGSGGAYVSGSTSKSGSGGSHATAGTIGTGGGVVGDTVGSADLTTMVFGAGGSGAAMNTTTTSTAANAASGGGIIFIAGVTVTVTGAITANGGNGADGTGDLDGGAGAGGSILIKAQTATLGTSLITATGGTVGGVGGAGGNGRIHIDYYTSYTGTTSPTITASQDTSLTTNVIYQLRLYTSSDGTTIDTYKQDLSSASTTAWKHYAVSVDVSASTAYFYEDGVALGSSLGALTSIYNSTALFAIGADFSGAGAARSFYDGLTDDVRLWSDIRTTSEISTNRQTILIGNEGNLVGYWKLDNAVTDLTSNANDLTLVNSPVYSTTIPFSAATTRRDIDQTYTSTGQTYSIPTVIAETAVARQTFVPAKDPQKSIAINIGTKGTTCDWTLTVHDTLNRTVATITRTNAELNTGVQEFTFTTPWTPIIGVSYHFHLTVTNTTGTPAVVTGTTADLETGQFTSYYQFLVNDEEYHPIKNALNFIVIGNGRYVAKWDGATYDPHRLTFPSGWRVRAIAPFREYMAFGCWKGNAMDDYDEGMVFFWDGISETYNYYINVPEGGINALLGTQGVLTIFAGYDGSMLRYSGGDTADTVKVLPNVGNGQQLEIMPGAISMWKTLIRIGAGITSSDTFEQGIYTYGSENKNYPDSLSFDYRISTENTQGNTIKVGMLLPVGGSLLYGWKDGLSYGLDSVTADSTIYADGSIDFLVRDEGGIWKEKKIDLIRADYEPLVSGQTIGIQYKKDRDATWSTELTDSTVGSTKLRYETPNTRHVEYQVRLNVTTTTTSPAIHGVTVQEDLLTAEEYV